MKITLFELAAERRAMIEHLTEVHDDPQVIADTLEGESDAIMVKLENCGYAIQTLRANSAAIREAAKRMLSRADAIDNQADRLTDYVQTNMQTAQIQNVSCTHFVMKVANNAESVEVYEPRLIPEKYLRTPPPPEPQPDKVALKAALKAGEEIQGCRLIRTQRLSIR